MPVAEAKRGYPVRLRGVITYYNPYNTNLVVQDESAGIYVRVGNSQVPKLEAGQLIDLDGFTGPGDVVPVITAPRIKVIGRAPLPAPMPIDPVRDSSPAPTTASGWRWPASSMPSSVATPAPTSASACTSSGSRWRFPASRRCRRACCTRASGRRVWPLRASTSAARCSASRCACRASTTCTSSRRRSCRRVTTIAELLQFTPSTRGDEPSAVQGVVLLTNPTGPTWLSDDTGGVLVATHARGAFAIGDVVRATGFAEPGAFNPVLRSAALTKVGSQAPPQAAPMTLDDILEDGWDAKLAQVEGFLTDRVAQQRPRAPHHRPGHADDRRRAARRSVAAGRGREPHQGDRRERDRRGRGGQHLHPARRHALPALGERHHGRRQPAVVDGAAHAGAGRRPRRRHGRHPGLGRPAAAPRVEADRRPALGQGRRRGGQPGQERVPGQREPRDPDADERRAGDDRAGRSRARSRPSSASA